MMPDPPWAMPAVNDVMAARRAARFYRRQGWNPLPSRPDAKRPPMRFADYWEKQGPEWWWTTRNPRFQVPNVQLMTGGVWGLVVVDLDGAGARAAFDRLALGRAVPSTWVSGRSESSVHIWFRLPDDVDVVPYRRLWVGPGKHQAVELLGERRLVTAPPSRHVVTGERYRFWPGHGPKSVPFPAECPRWLLELPDQDDTVPRRPTPAPCVHTQPPPDGRYDRRDVQAHLAGRWAEVARDYGVRVVGKQPTARGWVAAHVPWCEDRNPSGGISVQTGAFAAYGAGGETLSFFDTLVRMGSFHDWREALNHIGSRYGCPRKVS